MKAKTNKLKLDQAWTKEKAELLKRAFKLDIKLLLPLTEPKLLRGILIAPQRAPDGRTDIDTVAGMRKEKAY
jgi:hypothetical protein